MKWAQTDDTVPVEQFVLEGEEKEILLNKGQYKARIIDCNGKVVAQYKVEVD